MTHAQMHRANSGLIITRPEAENMKRERSLSNTGVGGGGGGPIPTTSNNHVDGTSKAGAPLPGSGSSSSRTEEIVGAVVSRLRDLEVQVANIGVLSTSKDGKNNGRYSSKVCFSIPAW
jgi:hypothetical protein